MLQDSSVQFYKDGYTDLSGRFDYASSNSDLIKNVKQFSILISDDDLGSIIKMVNKPSSIGVYQKEVQLKS